MDAVHPAPARPEPLRVLLLEDSSLDAELVFESLGGMGLPFALDRVIEAEDFRRAVEGGGYDLILADYVLPAFDGMSALAIAHQSCPDTPFVFVSGTLGEEVAIEALKRGATDYVLKQRLERLPVTILRALAEARERAERRRAEAAMRALLDEKTNLLHELDHRVKNNLQLLLSLVNYEMRRSEDAAVRDALGSVRERLQALGIVHRLLYGQEGTDTFDAGPFVRELCEDLIANRGRIDIALRDDVEPVPLPADLAAPTALFMNELVSAAITHAFESRRGLFKLKVRDSGGHCVIEIRDDVFSPQEKEAVRANATGPIQKALIRQLEAEVEWPGEPSLLVRVSFPTRHAQAQKKSAAR